jgi:hypothetical protein
MNCIAYKRMPCGGTLRIHEEKTGREYWYNDEIIWKPKDVHRVVLQQAILMEDELKYAEKNKDNPDAR